MPSVEVLAGRPAVAGETAEVGRLLCMNCGRDLCAVLGEAVTTLDKATLSCPPGAPPALRVSATVLRCGGCGGRVVFEYS